MPQGEPKAWAVVGMGTAGGRADREEENEAPGAVSNEAITHLLWSKPLFKSVTVSFFASRLYDTKERIDEPVGSIDQVQSQQKPPEFPTTRFQGFAFRFEHFFGTHRNSENFVKI